jgi:hypothetical protein
MRVRAVTLRLPSLIHDELPRLGVRSHGLVQADRIEAAGHWNSGKALSPEAPGLRRERARNETRHRISLAEELARVFTSR